MQSKKNMMIALRIHFSNNWHRYILEKDRNHWKWVLDAMESPQITTENFEAWFDHLAMGIPYEINWEQIRK